MSSFPEHEENIKELERIGFDVSEHIEDGEVTVESWHYDDLVYLVSDIIAVLNKQGFTVDEESNNE